LGGAVAHVNANDGRGDWLAHRGLGEVFAFSKQQEHGDVVVATTVVGRPDEVGANSFGRQVRGEEKSDLVVMELAGETVRTQQQPIVASERQAMDRDRESARAADGLEKDTAIREGANVIGRNATTVH
jgi:hypothetical protein